MSYGEPPSTFKTFPKKEEQDWSRQYAEELKLVEGKTSQTGLPDCAWTFPNSGGVLTEWENNRRAVELNMVIVSPNSGKLPIRALSYTVGALETATSLMARGIKVRSLRIINPCYLNAYCDDGDLAKQVEHGRRFAKRLTKYKNRLPDLRSVEIKLDQGKPITGLTEQARNLRNTLQENSLDFLRERMERHAESPNDENLTLYVWAHGPAWRYAKDPEIFDDRMEETPSINYMPRSEMPFVIALSNAGINVTPTATDTVSIFSNRIRHAPYLPIRGVKDELRFAWSLSAVKLQNLNSKLSKKCGDPRMAEIHSCTGHLQSFFQRTSRR